MNRESLFGALCTCGADPAGDLRRNVHARWCSAFGRTQADRQAAHLHKTFGGTNAGWGLELARQVLRGGSGVHHDACRKTAIDLARSYMELDARVEGMASVRRCNDPMPGGDGMQLCDRWPDHDGPHYNAEGLQWKQR